MAATVIPEYPRGVTFEDVWAAIRETQASLKETQATIRENAESLKETRRKNAEEMEETRRKNAEQMEETRRKNAEEMEETRRRLKEREEYWDREFEKSKRILDRNSRQMGGLHRRFGELAEHLVCPGISKRFNELGYHFDSVSPGGYKILDEQGKTKTEIDIVLENGEYIIAVEVKTRPVFKDIGHHVKRLEILRENRSKKRDERIIRGAIAGAVFGAEEKEAAIAAGLYVLEQSGDTMKIDIPDGFVPQEW